MVMLKWRGMVPYKDPRTICGEGRRAEHEGFLFVCFCVSEKVRNITLRTINESLDKNGNVITMYC